MFPIPFPRPSAVDWLELRERVQMLETALALTQGLLQDLLGRLEGKLGPGFLGENLVLVANDTGLEAGEHGARIDTLLRQGKQPEAARFVREFAGVTWDQAHYATKRWEYWPPEQRLRWVQLALWVKALGAPPSDVGSSQKGA